MVFDLGQNIPLGGQHFSFPMPVLIDGLSDEGS